MSTLVDFLFWYVWSALEVARERHLNILQLSAFSGVQKSRLESMNAAGAGKGPLEHAT